MLYGDFSSIDLLKGHKTLHDVLVYWRDNASSLADGKHDLFDGIFAQAKTYSPGPKAEKRYETHVKYADIQCVLEGEEFIYVTPREQLTLKEEFLADRDVAFYHPPAPAAGEMAFLMRPGNFLLLYPEDGHQPDCKTTSDNNRKVIFKIPMTLLK